MKVPNPPSRYCRSCLHRDKDGVCDISKLLPEYDTVKTCIDAGWREVRQSLNPTRHSASTGQWADALKGR